MRKHRAGAILVAVSVDTRLRHSSCIDSINVLASWHDFTVGRIISAEFVNDQPTRFGPLGFELMMPEGKRLRWKLNFFVVMPASVAQAR